MSRVARNLVRSMVSAVLLLAGAAAFGAGCSARMAERADAAIDSLDSWKAVDGFYAKYRACDDGSIAEGVSEAVIRLLVDRRAALRDTPPPLLKPALRRFVVAHVDTTVATQDLEALAKSDETDCASALADFCREIKVAAARALK